MLSLLSLVPLLPLAGFAVLGLFGRRLRSERAVGVIACGTVFLAFLISAGAVVEYANRASHSENRAYLSSEAGPAFPHQFVWIPGGAAVTSLGGEEPEAIAGGLTVRWVYQLDALSAVMLLVVTGVGFLIHVFATGYMRGDTGFARFFAYLNLFMFAMLVLVLGSNLAMTFVGWEGVGLCSYLLIGYYIDRDEAANAAKKAFIANRIGDAGFLLAMFGLFALFGTFDFEALRAAVLSPEGLSRAERLGEIGLLGLIALGLFVGATGKSAQIPLFVWLPDAMAGPTPVSALIHAATMVTAGVYLLARMSFLFVLTPTVMLVVAVIGAATALLAAAIAITQNDIKKVLAYSTVSQLGYMFLACGAGAFAIAIFHVFTHAFFKALLFLGAGSVIHGMHHEQDMRRMGGLKRFMPVTHATMLVAWLAICGIFPFAGFFSKDEILWKTFSSSVLPEGAGIALWAVGLVTAAMTAFYMTRLMAMTFWGAPRFRTDPSAGLQHDEAVAQSEANLLAGDPTSPDFVASGTPTTPAEDHLHGGHDDHVDAHGHAGAPRVPVESPRAMTVPLVALGVLSVVGGWVGISAIVPLVGSHEPPFVRWLAPAVAHVDVLDSSSVGASAGSASSDVQPRAVAEVPSGAPAMETGGRGGDDAHHGAEPIEYALALLSLMVAGASMYLGYMFYVKRPELPERIAARAAGLYRASLNKFWVDEAYGVFPIGFTLKLAVLAQLFDRAGVDRIVNETSRVTRFGSIVSRFIDKYVVDMLVKATGGAVQVGSYVFNAAQTGYFQNYALVFVLGLLAFLAYFQWDAVIRFVTGVMAG